MLFSASKILPFFLFFYIIYFLCLFYFSYPFLVRFSGLPTPSCQKENHNIRPEISRIRYQKVKETLKIAFQFQFLEIWLKNFLTRYARQKTISAYISRKLDQKYTITSQQCGSAVQGEDTPMYLRVVRVPILQKS